MKKDLTGNKFGRLTVISEAPATGGRSYWNCVCECGVPVTKQGSRLRSGHTKSCGCLKGDAGELRVTHGHAPAGDPSPEYRSWASMVARCNQETESPHPSYGGRGISVCARWSRFEAFLADVGPRPSLEHSIDRVDNNGNYEPGNVRWATRKEQARNRRNGVWIERDGKRLVVSEWAAQLRINPQVIYKRVRRGITDPNQLLAHPNT